MSSSKQAAASYTITSPMAAIELSLLDHDLRLVKRGRGRLSGKAPPGHYLVEARAGAEQHEQIIRLGAGLNAPLSIDLKITAASPAGHTATSHEYHGYPAINLSKGTPGKLGRGGRLMLFARDLTPKLKNKNEPRPLIHRLELDGLDVRNQRFDPLSIDEFVHTDVNDRWIGLIAEVDPGGYLIQAVDDDGPERIVRSFPVWVTEGWTTAVFVVREPDSPRWLWDAAAIQMFRITDGYQAYPSMATREGALAVEMALCGLRTGQQLISEQELDDLLQGKFRNPMLGIIGCHLLLRQPTLNPTDIRMVLGNLSDLVGDHPDVLALHAIAQDKGFPEVRRSRVLWPPMLRESYEGLIAHSWRGLGARIQLEAYAMEAAALRIGAGPWNMLRYADRPAPRGAPSLGLGGGAHLESRRPIAAQETVREYLEVVRRRQRGAPAAPSAADVARALHLPLDMARSALMRISRDERRAQAGEVHEAPPRRKAAAAGPTRRRKAKAAARKPTRRKKLLAGARPPRKRAAVKSSAKKAKQPAYKARKTKKRAARKAKKKGRRSR